MKQFLGAFLGMIAGTLFLALVGGPFEDAPEQTPSDDKASQPQTTAGEQAA